MKILIINTNDITGGAARAAFRLHESLLQSGIDSQMLVMNKISNVNSVLTPHSSNFARILRKVLAKLDQLPVKKYKQMKKSKWGPLSPAKIKNKKLIEKINLINPDIVHLHWICGGMVAIEDLVKIKAPIVWSLHDMWAFTGGCHVVAEQVQRHSGERMPRCRENNVLCEKYTSQCQRCGVLGSDKIKDLSYRVLKRKKKIFAKISRMTIIGLSRWLQGCAKSSSVFSNKTVINLPNPINTSVFKPLGKDVARNMWNLPLGKKLVLFGAMSATSTPYKGFVELTEALNKISAEDVEFVVFGSSEPQNPPKFSCKVHYLGHLYDDLTLMTLYSACDVMAHPSKRENLSNVIMESLSCELPVVAFDIGGNSDMIDHQQNGYLAQPFDTSDFAKGIEWVLNNENYNELCKNAREKVVREFDYDVVGKRYIKLYEEVLG